MNSPAQLWFICVNIFILCIYCAKCEISAENSHVWGPGLKSYFTVPVRFFYIQAVKTSGENFTESPSKGPFAVSIHQQDTGGLARVATEILDRNDGTFLVRYKLYGTYRDLKIEVVLKTSGKHVSKSPYILKGNVYHEACYCPVDNTEKWMKALQCRDTEKQVERDLTLFDKIDMSTVEKDVLKRYNRPHAYSLCHYVVKDNKIYRKTYGEHVGFKIFMDAMLLSLARKVVLPDIEMFVNLGDWPLDKKSTNGNKLPIFSWCGSEDTNDIIMPTYDLTESTLETMGRVSLDLMSVQGNTGPSWDKKNDTAIWRGRDSREERLQLVRMSRKHPEVIDAALTNMFFFPKNETDYGEVVPHISFFDFFKYKYQINIDGTVAAYRLPYLLAGDSVVLKQDSPYYEHFYKDLVPMKHFIPFKRDLSDLMDRLMWAKKHEDEAKKMAKQAQVFVRENLMSNDILCYHVLLFKEYSKKLTRPVAPQKDMELVTQPNDSESHCKCPRLKNSKAQKRKDEL